MICLVFIKLDTNIILGFESRINFNKKIISIIKYMI